jgi:hypothetical protein
MLNKAQVEEISKIIREHIGAAIYTLTASAPSGVDIQHLRDIGIIDATVPTSAIADAYLFGVLTALTPAIASAPLSTIKDLLRKLPLSSFEKTSIKWLNESAALYCQGLGNRIDATTMRIMHDAEKALAMTTSIRETMANAAAERKTLGEMVTLLRRATGDVQRDWHRIVNTELHAARTQGVAHGIEKQFGADASVIVRPHPDCCDLCRAAYLHGGVPKVFKLADLAARNNVGRTTAELRTAPGLPGLHPFCACEVSYFNPEIHKFNDQGQIVFKGKG